MKYFILHARLICKSYFYIDCEIAAAVRCAGNGEHNGCFQVSFPIPMRLWNWIFPRCRFILFFPIMRLTTKVIVGSLFPILFQTTLSRKRMLHALPHEPCIFSGCCTTTISTSTKENFRGSSIGFHTSDTSFVNETHVPKKTCNPDIFHATFVWNMLKHLEPAASNAKCCTKLVNSVKVHQLCMESR